MSGGMTMHLLPNNFLFILIIIYTVSFAHGFPQKEVSLNQDDSICHPVPKSFDQVYIIGYGSLINTASKQRSYPNSSVNIPVNVKGFVRKFNCKGVSIGLSTTYLGVDADPKASFNGIVFKLPNKESLAKFDKREMFYCRQEVDVKDIDFLIGKNFSQEVDAGYPTAGAQFYIYVVKPEFNELPSPRYPIVQSYVDVFLTGCLEMEETYKLKGYPDRCMNTTEGWDYPWVDDRIMPRRPFANIPKASAIDRLVNSHLPKHFESVMVEQEIRFQRSSGNWALVPNRIGIVITLTIGILWGSVHNLG